MQTTFTDGLLFIRYLGIVSTLALKHPLVHVLKNL